MSFIENNNHNVKLTRKILQSPNKLPGIPKLLLEGKWLTRELGLAVGDEITIDRLPGSGHIIIKKV